MRYQLLEWSKMKSWGRVSYGWRSVSSGDADSMRRLQGELELCRPGSKFVLLAPGESLTDAGYTVGVAS